MNGLNRSSVSFVSTQTVGSDPRSKETGRPDGETVVTQVALSSLAVSDQLAASASKNLSGHSVATNSASQSDSADSVFIQAIGSSQTDQVKVSKKSFGDQFIDWLKKLLALFNFSTSTTPIRELSNDEIQAQKTYHGAKKRYEELKEQTQGVNSEELLEAKKALFESSIAYVKTAKKCGGDFSEPKQTLVSIIQESIAEVETLNTERKRLKEKVAKFTSPEVYERAWREDEKIHIQTVLPNLIDNCDKNKKLTWKELYETKKRLGWELFRGLRNEESSELPEVIILDRAPGTSGGLPLPTQGPSKSPKKSPKALKTEEIYREKLLAKLDEVLAAKAEGEEGETDLGLDGWRQVRPILQDELKTVRAVDNEFVAVQSFLFSLEELTQVENIQDNLQFYSMLFDLPETLQELGLDGQQLKEMSSKIEEIKTAKEEIQEKNRQNCVKLGGSIKRVLAHLKDCSVHELKQISEKLSPKSITEVINGFVASFKQRKENSIKQEKEDPEVKSTKDPAASLVLRLAAAHDTFAAAERRANDKELEGVERAMDQLELVYGPQVKNTKEYASLVAMQKFLQEDDRLETFTEATKDTYPVTILACHHQRRQQLALATSNYEDLKKEWGKELSSIDTLKEAWKAESFAEAMLAGLSEQNKYILRGEKLIEIFNKNPELKEKFLDQGSLRSDLLVKEFYAGTIQGLLEDLKQTVEKFAQGHLTKTMLDCRDKVSSRLKLDLTIPQQTILGRSCGEINTTMQGHITEIEGRLKALREFSKEKPLTEEEAGKLTDFTERLSFLREEHKKFSQAYETLPQELKGPPLSETLVNLGVQLGAMEAVLYNFIAPPGALLTKLKELPKDLTKTNLQNPEYYQIATELIQDPAFASMSSLKKFLDDQFEAGSYEHLSDDAKAKLTKLRDLSTKAAVITPQNLTEAYTEAQKNISIELKEVEAQLKRKSEFQAFKDSFRRGLLGAEMLPQLNGLQIVEARIFEHKGKMHALKIEVEKFNQEIEKISKKTKNFWESEEGYIARISQEVAAIATQRQGVQKQLDEVKEKYEKDVEETAKLRTEGSAETWKSLGDSWLERYKQLQEFPLEGKKDIDFTVWELIKIDDPIRLKEEAIKLRQQLTDFLEGAQFSEGSVALETRKAALEIERAEWEKLKPPQQQSAPTPPIISKSESASSTADSLDWDAS